MLISAMSPAATPSAKARALRVPRLTPLAIRANTVGRGVIAGTKTAMA